MMHHLLSSLAIFATLLGSTLGVETTPRGHGSGSSPGLRFEDVCYFSFPSYSCVRKCERLGKLAYCHHQGETCLCVERKNQLEKTEDGTNLPSMDEDVTDDDRGVKYSEECFFTFTHLTPSYSCTKKCKMLGKQPLCHDKTMSCECTEKDTQVNNTQNGSNDSEEAVYKNGKAQDNYCWFGTWPSNACRRRCGLKGKGAYCVRDSPTNECKCKEEEEEETQLIAPAIELDKPQTQDAGTQTDYEDDESQSESAFHPMLIFIKLGGLFGTNEVENGEREEEEEGAEGLYGQQDGGDRSTIAPEGKMASNGITRDQLWTLKTLAASGVIVLLLALVGIELYALYARRRSEKGIAHILNTLPTTTKT